MDATKLIATWFGAGLLRPAPGTIGTLAAMPLGFAIMWVGGYKALAAAIVVLMIVGTVAAGNYGKRTGETDNQSIVVDEAVGVWIAALPAGTHLWTWVAAFLLFRLFDIWKPWPASFFDNRCKGGFDVMMDDVVAGIYAALGVCIVALPYYYQ
jgi:phosphatidylglycerophosphatase A